MIRLTVAGFLAALSTITVAEAEPIIVRSGEHETFTRLVLPLAEGQIWRLEQEPGISRVVFEEHDDGFDLSLAFDIIPRTRLTALLAQASVLEMQLSCDCPVKAFTEQDTFLVIDIADGPELQPEEVAPVHSAELPRSDFSYGELLWGRGPEGAQSEAMAPTSLDAQSESRNIETERAQTAEIVLQTQNRLLEAFSGAASRGVLDPKWDALPEVEEKTDRSNENPEIFDSSRAAQELALPATGNIRITDSKDVPDDSVDENLGVSGATCPAPDLVAIASWGTDESFGLQLGKSNEELYDDLGRLNPPSVVSRAKLYLFFGFGAEARQTLGLLPNLQENRPELFDLANILEYGFSSNPRSLHRFAECPSDVALWGILAAKELPRSTAIDTEAALRALESLPSHLKFFLAQELSKRLLQRGDTENASIAMRSYARLEESKTSEPTIAESDLSRVRGNNEEADNILDEIITEDTQEAPEAIIELVKQHVDADTPVPAEIALLAESYAFELRNSDNGDEMFGAFVIASAKSSQFEKAFHALEEGGGRLNDAAKVAVADLVFKELTKNADDAEFLHTFFARFPTMSDTLSAETQLALATRLFELGFLDEAGNMLDNYPVADWSADATLLKAEILQASDRYRESLEVLEGMETSDAFRLRGEALQQLGQNEAAARLFASANMPERAVSSLWLADDWSTLVDPTTPVFGPLSDLKAQAPSLIETNPQMLANTQDALANSAETRDVLETALNALELSE